MKTIGQKPMVIFFEYSLKTEGPLQLLVTMLFQNLFSPPANSMSHDQKGQDCKACANDQPFD